MKLENGQEISVTLRDLAPNPSPSSQHDRITENDVTNVSSQEQTDFVFNEVRNDVSNSVDVLPHCDSAVVNDNGHKDNQLPKNNSFLSDRRFLSPLVYSFIFFEISAPDLGVATMPTPVFC